MSGIIENLGNAVTSMFRGKPPQAQPSSTKVRTIPWGLEAFPDDGSGRSLHIKAGDTLHFVPIDDNPHNVAEAEIVDEDEWLPSRDRQLGINFRTRRGFNEQLKINKAGTYYLVCPVDGHHRVMRLTIVANGSSPQLSQQVKAQLDKAKQQTRQAMQDARSRVDEARQAMTQAQQQQTAAAQQRAQQAMQRADQARQQAQNALQRLEDLARQLGQDAAQVVNDVTQGIQQGVQQGVSNVANQAMSIVTSLTNPLKKIGPLGPVNNHILESVQILQGTGTFASRFPNFDLSQFNILNQNRVVGPLGPVVRRTSGGQPRSNGVASQQQPQNGSLPAAVMVNNMQEDEEEIVAFGPAVDEQRRQARHARHHQRDVAVRWDTNALLSQDGSVRTLEVPQGTVITFHSTDGRPHNLVEVNSNFSAKKMPMVVSEISDQLHQVLRMSKAGTYYFISTTDPQTMRLIVKVNPRDATDEIINGA